MTTFSLVHASTFQKLETLIYISFSIFSHTMLQIRNLLIYYYNYMSKLEHNYNYILFCFGPEGLAIFDKL